MDNDHETEMPRAREFLSAEAKRVDHKIKHLAGALNDCDDCLEAKGLQGMLNNMQLERDLLCYLMYQSDGHNVSLDAVILQQISQYQREIQRLFQNGYLRRSIPAGYWKAEVKRAFLFELLGRYHAWCVGRPYYSDGASNNRQ